MLASAQRGKRWIDILTKMVTTSQATFVGLRRPNNLKTAGRAALAFLSSQQSSGTNLGGSSTYIGSS
jgi:hypothetical protein